MDVFSANSRAADPTAAEHGGVHRAILESTNQGFCIIELMFDKDGRAIDYRFVEANPALERQSGLRDVVGRRVRELAPDLEEHWFERYGRVALTGEPLRIEGEVAPLGRWLDINAFRVGDPAQYLVAVLFTDITERHNAETALRESQERQTFLLKLSDTLRAEPSAEAIANRALRMLFEQMGLDRCYIGIYRLEEDTGEFPYQVHDENFMPLPARVRLSDFPKALEIASDRTLVIDDVAKMEGLSDDDRASFEGLALRAIVTATVREGKNNPLWAIIAGSMHPRKWTQSEITLVEDVAERTWAAVERAKSDTELRQSDERYRTLALVGLTSIYRMSPDWSQMHKFDGAGFIVNTDAPKTDWITTYIPADEQPRVKEAIARAIRNTEPFELEHRVLRADGSTGWTFSRAIPLLDDVGDIVEWFGVASDVSARVKADQSFTRLFEASPAPFLVLAPDSPRFTITEVNDAYLAATMRTREDVVGRALFDAYPDNPDNPTSKSTSILKASLERVLATRRPDELPGLNYDIPSPDGMFEERWWSPVNSPILDDKGEVEAIIHNANDVTEARRAQQRHGLLLAELQHRVRNILTMVRSVARRTADNCDDVDDYVRHLDGRLAALARVQTILTRDPGQGVDLHDLVHDELQSQAASADHYAIDGPRVELPAKAAEVLSLAVHELATNSTKYGVLSTSNGTICIGWAVEDRDGQAWLRWSWHEPTEPDVERPARTGFGSELIVRRVPYELRGTGHLLIGDGQVEARIDFPVANEPLKMETVATGRDLKQ